jgi:hypothetical protein
MILEAVVGVTVEVVDVIAHGAHLIAHVVHLIAHGAHLIAQITITHVTMTQVLGTQHTTATIATALARVAAMMMLVALTVIHHSGRMRASTG